VTKVAVALLGVLCLLAVGFAIAAARFSSHESRED